MEEQIYALFKDENTVLSPREIAKGLKIEKSLVNRHLAVLLRDKKLSVSRTESSGDPRYRLGEGEKTAVKGNFEMKELIDLLEEMEETTAPVLAKKILGTNKRDDVSLINSKLYELNRDNRVSRRIDETEAYPLWSLKN